jgi:hypothetical protein
VSVPGLTWLARLGDGLGAGTPKDDDVQKRVGAQPVGAVHRRARGLAGRVQSGNDHVLAVLVSDHLQNEEQMNRNLSTEICREKNCISM